MGEVSRRSTGIALVASMAVLAGMLWLSWPEEDRNQERRPRVSRKEAAAARKAERAAQSADRASATPAPSGTASSASGPAWAFPPEQRQSPGSGSASLLEPDATASKKAVEQDLENLEFVFRDYRTALGGNPVGTNAEIMQQLRGDNLKQVKLSLPEGMRLNAEGELCDRWGTPLFFHQLSKDEIEIRSAGPDRELWTSDDIVR